MESISTESGKTYIYLPGVETTAMEIVLQFLYTGKMKITKSLMEPVQALLEQVLRIDTSFKMPTCQGSFGLQETSRESNNYTCDVESGYGTDTNSILSDSASFVEPPRER